MVLYTVGLVLSLCQESSTSYCNSKISECQSGQYGRNCNETCGHCLGGQDKCSTTNGHCPNGCAAGWEGDVCKTGLS